MAERKANFTEDSAKRIANTVRAYENSPLFKAALRKKAPVITNEGFWAIITDTDDAGKYSWTALEPQSDGSLSSNSDWGSGSHSDSEGYAVNAEGRDDIQDDAIVWLTPARGQDYYLFSGGDSEATLYKATLNGALATTDATATIDGAIPVNGSDGSPTSADNLHDMEGDDNADCWVVRIGSSYYLIQVTCPA